MKINERRHSGWLDDELNGRNWGAFQTSNSHLGNIASWRSMPGQPRKACSFNMNPGIGACMQQTAFKDLREVIAKMPQWLRNDLSSLDPGLRERAEDALHAMLVAALDATETRSS